MNRFLSRSVITPRTNHGRQAFFALSPPTVLYSNNHLLAVNKPAGWHSIPNTDGMHKKCLLTWLKCASLGGGSRRDFLMPLHRLDQPCTGVLLLAKTSKAASRITKQWKRHHVTKEYQCVLPSCNAMKALKGNSAPTYDECWYELKGLWKPSRKVGSVTMIPVKCSDDYTSSSAANLRLCTIEWRHVETMGKHPVVLVKTREGSRHMIRALLSQVGGAPICGDLRYGALHALPDKSVALHASRVTLPDSLVLPLDQYEFDALLPTQWKSWFR